MPWCPNCKNEYKAGYTVCADCGATLVESLEEGKKAVYFGGENELYQISDFMRANGMKNTEISYDKKEGTYELLVEADDVVAAQKMIHVYLQKIAAPSEAKKQQEIHESYSEEELAAMKQMKEAYIKEMERKPYEDTAKIAEEYKSGADSLLIVGVVGIIALVLLHLGVIPISLPPFTKWMITGVMGFLFVVFVFMGIASRKSYANLKEQAGSDHDTKEDVIKYLKENVNPVEFDADLITDDPGMEILYFRRMEKLKAMVFSYVQGIDVSFAEYILEEVYPDIFE